MKTVFFLISVLLVLNVFSQEIDDNNDTILLPTSIYTSSFDKLQTINSLLLINKKLNLTSFEFVILNTKAIKNGNLSISTENIGKQPTKFIIETYQKIAMNKAMTSAFFDIDALYYNRTNYPSGRD
ncbi:MAG: hypothetical protein L3J14_01030 [Flavobacteriaceae bacterium]|nr:hypothetical protein [Flavobacteriaceae bacterium]